MVEVLVVELVEVLVEDVELVDDVELVVVGAFVVEVELIEDDCVVGTVEVLAKLVVALPPSISQLQKVSP